MAAAVKCEHEQLTETRYVAGLHHITPTRNVQTFDMPVVACKHLSLGNIPDDSTNLST